MPSSTANAKSQGVFWLAKMTPTLSDAGARTFYAIWAALGDICVLVRYRTILEPVLGRYIYIRITAL